MEPGDAAGCLSLESFEAGYPQNALPARWLNRSPSSSDRSRNLDTPACNAGLRVASSNSGRSARPWRETAPPPDQVCSWLAFQHAAQAVSLSSFSIVRNGCPQPVEPKACYAILSPVLNRTSSLRRMQLLQQSPMMCHAPKRRHPRRYFPRSARIVVPLRTVSV